MLLHDIIYLNNRKDTKQAGMEEGYKGVCFQG
jgi:hypothetical protein